MMWNDYSIVSLLESLELGEASLKLFGWLLLYESLAYNLE